MKIRIAGKYFSYVAKAFPVMCASGIFPYFPPVTDAAKWLDRYDDLSAKGIVKHVAKLKKFQQEFTTLASNADSMKEQAVARALKLNVNGVITELEQICTWKKSPALYLQIAFTGLSHAADMPSKNERTRLKRFIKRLRALPMLLELAPQNIEATTPTHRALAQTMIRDCARFLKELGESHLGKTGKISHFLGEGLTSLREFDRFVTALQEAPDKEGVDFNNMLRNVLGTERSAASIFTIAEEEFNNHIQSLHLLEAEIKQGWQEAYTSYEGPAEEGKDALDVVIREIHRLRRFVHETAFPGIFSDTNLRIDPQPLYLASTLRPIHHNPALGAWPNEPSRCHISPQLFTGRGFRDDPAYLKRMKREYVFLTARQSYPGRHLVDSQRRTLEKSPMMQISSQFFISGWLAFAENLLDKMAYLQNPLDRLVLHQRGLARAALAMVDAGLAVGNLDQDKCLCVLGDAGFSTRESLNHVRSIRLSPASRIMPVLGLHEINQLRRKSQLELGQFCTQLFAHGQLQFADIGQLMHR